MDFSLVPGPTLKMKRKDWQLLLVTFSQEVENPTISVYLLSEEDYLGLLLPDFGQLEPFKIPSLGLGTLTWAALERTIWNYLPSKRNCLDSTIERDYSHMKCKLEKLIKCYKEIAPKYNCTCVPKNTFKSYLEINPFDNWDECNTNAEYGLCLRRMETCSYELESKCRPHCKKVEYKGQHVDLFGVSLPINTIGVHMTFNTMDTEIHTEVWQFDFATFIGTVGGSFGLFIGFSLTGFVGQVLDYFMRY